MSLLDCCASASAGQTHSGSILTSVATTPTTISVGPPNGSTKAVCIERRWIDRYRLLRRGGRRRISTECITRRSGLHRDVRRWTVSPGRPRTGEITATCQHDFAARAIILSSVKTRYNAIDSADGERISTSDDAFCTAAILDMIIVVIGTVYINILLKYTKKCVMIFRIILKLIIRIVFVVTIIQK